jgi:hypothetical protein
VLRSRDMKLLRILVCWPLLHAALAAPADDYRAVTAGVSAIPMGGTAGAVALQGRLAFPLAISKKNEVPAGAGYFGDVEKGGRIVAFAHTSFGDAGTEEQKRFLQNVVRWAGRKDGAKVLCLGGSGRGWKAAGIDAQPANGVLTEAMLRDAQVVTVNLHSGAMRENAAVLEKFAAGGGGLILLATPWAADKAQIAAANTLLTRAGLGFLNSGPSETSYEVTAAPPSANWSALNAIEAILADKKGTAPLALEEKRLCAATLEAAFAGGDLQPAVAKGADELHAAFGWIRFVKAPALKRANNPVEAMLARYQARLLDKMPPDKLPAHPSAADFPGAVGEGPAVQKTIAFDATTGPDKLINSGSKTIINTGLYARPGAPISVTLPETAVKAGLRVEIGIHIDHNWNLGSWHRAPQVTRDEELKQAVTPAGNAFGGLVSILVPANCKLGKTQATIAGAVEAPVFTLGKTTEAEWHARVKNAPGAWGYIETPKWTGYVPRDILQKVEHPEAVAKYWQRVVDTADEYMGYAKWRRRGEAMLTDRDITVGYGHSGYPVMMAYAAEKEGVSALVERGPERGDWGFLHELGHTFQDSFDGNYTIATHAEVDVNLVPGITMMLIHDRTAWDNNCHSTFDAKNRVRDMEKWLAQPESERTWDKACKGSSVAYDFYFTMAECFGWDLYKKALGRLADALHQPGTDAELEALNPKDPNFKRNRFFLCFCQAAGRNLLPHFEKYGLGKGDFGLTPAVVEKVKTLPAWSGNEAITALNGPANVTVAKGAAPGAVVATFKAVDPDLGTRFTFRIAAGNEDGTFEIQKRTGVLKTVKAPAKADYLLKVEVSDSTIPATTKEAACVVKVQ